MGDGRETGLHVRDSNVFYALRVVVKFFDLDVYLILWACHFCGRVRVRGDGWDAGGAASGVAGVTGLVMLSEVVRFGCNLVYPRGGNRNGGCGWYQDARTPLV